MSILCRQDLAGAGGPRVALLRVVLSSLLMHLSPVALAQTGNPEQTPAVPAEDSSPIVVSLPTSQQMALALVTPKLRGQALLDLAVAANVVSRTAGELEAGPKLDQASLAQGFLDDRAWLQSIVDRFGWLQPHEAVLDPAGWLLFARLQQNDMELEKIPLLVPGRLPREVLLAQVFQRAVLSLAVASLPNLLLEVESDVFTLWDAFLQVAENDGSTDAAWKAVELSWFADRQLPPPVGADEAAAIQLVMVENVPQAMSNIVLGAMAAGPPDEMGLMRLRYTLLNVLQTLTGEENVQARDQASDLLYLISLIDGLHEGRYIDFVQGMLAITAGLLESPVNPPESFSLVDWLVGKLPTISAHYAVNFASVDPRLNTALASAYDVLARISGFTTGEPVEPEVRRADIRASRLVLADAVAQLALLIPDMAYYFEIPVREKIASAISKCMGSAVSLDENGVSAMTRRDFDQCMETLLQLADQETRVTELAGDMTGPFTSDTLRRELSVAPWQRINYVVGYIQKRFSSGCLPPARVLPNPLEWSVLANVMSWFAVYSPEFFATTENENRIARMRNIGEEIIQAMLGQTECLAGSGAGFNDLISRSMVDYEIALRNLESGISKVVTGFRTQRLSPGADVALDQDALQSTAFRPDNFVIAPCDARSVCEMSGNLSATRALIGLFPNQYLVAEQTGMGHIEICYRNMEWVQRRSELVRADDENIAHYFGHMAFDLVGRYVDDGQYSDIFGFRFTSPKETLYLLASASGEVLDDSCPVEWVGRPVVTSLRKNNIGIVPDRLTYLAVARKLPSRLLQDNWDRGAEWRDWFVTGSGVTPLELPAAPEIITRLNQHLQTLYQAEQLGVYQRLLLPSYRDPQGRDESLNDELSEVSMAKDMLRMQMLLFFPESLETNDAIRTALAGDGGLLEQRTLQRFREANVPLAAVNRISRERLNRFRAIWSQQPEAMRQQATLPGSLVYALTRINSLYRQFYIAQPESLPESQPETLQEIEVTGRARTQDP